MEFNLSDPRKLSVYNDALTTLQNRLFLLLLTEEIDTDAFEPKTFTPAVGADSIPLPNHEHIKSLGLQVEKLKEQIANLRGE